MTSLEKPAFSTSSLLCRQSISSVVLASSEEAGWTSVLVDHHRVRPNEEPFETHPTPDQTIVVMLRGEQRIECFTNGTWRQALYQAGTIGMTPGHAIDRLRRRVRDGSPPCEKANVYIPQQFFLEASDHYRRAGHRRTGSPLTVLAFNDPAVVQTVSALLRAMSAGSPDLYAQTAMQWLAVHLLSNHSTWLGCEGDRRVPGTISDKRLARVLEYMSARFAEPLTLDDLATEACISKFHFARLFRESTGLAPHAFLSRLRMDAARRMLTTTDLSVTEIAARCGFARTAHFGTAFTKRFGMSPTAFRSRARG